MARTREIAGLVASILALLSSVAMAQDAPSGALAQRAPPPSAATAAAPADRPDEAQHDPLWRAYYHWSFVQLCYLGRDGEGYDNKLERARAVIKSIERKALAKDPKTSLDETFADADGSARTAFASGLLQGDRCTQALNALLAMNPAGAARRPGSRPANASGNLSARRQ